MDLLEAKAWPCLRAGGHAAVAKKQSNKIAAKLHKCGMTIIKHI